MSAAHTADWYCRLKNKGPAWLTGPLIEGYEVQINGFVYCLCLRCGSFTGLLCISYRNCLHLPESLFNQH